MTVDEGVDISKAGDRGVLKRIIQEGQGTDTPNAGCQVTVHYTGTLLDGTKFDSSKDRNDPFEFQLGKGSVIKAWDIGVATMKKGEVCVLTCAPEYAYGASGSPPKIPPNATLQFEIEMIDWKVEDLSPNKNKGILRHIIEQGEGFDNPNDGALVTVELEGKLIPDGKVFDTRTVTFPLGEGADTDVCEGVERALEKFLKGEKSRLTIQSKYAFKSEGNTELGVPANTAVEYVVKLTNFEKAKESWSMDGPEKLEQAKIYKEKGTNYFKAGKHQLAIKMYKRVVTLLEDVPEDNSVEEEQKSQAKELLLSSHLNLALVYLKVVPPHNFESRDHATKALGFDAANVKGLFRRGQALLGLGDAEQALRDFQRVVQAEPQNKAAANQVAVCRQAIQKQKQKEKRLYANMFDKFAKHDTEVTVELEGKLIPDGKVFDTRTVTFPLGEGADTDVCEGVERALEKFLKGEKSRLTIQSKYAFKSEGNTELGVPANTAVEYVVKLTNFEKAKESWSMDGPEKLEQAKIYKEKGTNYFKAGKHQLAIKMYKRVVTLLEDVPEDNSVEEEQKSQAKELLLSSHLNLALVYLKVVPPHNFESRDHATKALGFDAANVKGLFRRGQALLGLGDAEQALRDFQRVVQAEPQNKAAANQVAVCRQAIQKQKQKEKRLYANMFDKFAKHDTELEKIRAKEEVDVIGSSVGEWGAGEGEWTDEQRTRKPTHFERENPNILMLDRDGQFQNM